MSAVTRPKGSLPARVYWVRRLLVLAVAFGLVFGIARLLGGGGGDGDPAVAVPAAASASPTTSGPTTTAEAMATPSEQVTAAQEPGTKQAGKRHGRKRHQPTVAATPLAVPTGPCEDSDVQVTPAVRPPAYAGQDVRITLRLSTYASPACTWKVSPRSVVVKVSSGDDRIWTTQDCPAALEKQSVVLRSDHVTRTYLTWHGQRSDDDCSRTTPWAMPGYYHVKAAALGADPVDVQFRLRPPPRPTITPTPTPTPEKSRKSDRPTDEPTAGQT